MRPLQTPVDIGSFEAQRMLTVTLPSSGGAYRLLADGFDLVLQVQGGADVFRYEHAAILTLSIDGSAASDQLIVDFSQGTAVPIEGILFDGAGGSDSLIVTGTSAAQLSHSLNDAGTGSIVIDGMRVGFQDVSDISDDVRALNRSVQFADGDDVISVAVGATPGQSLIDHNGSNISFPQAGQTLVIDANDGDDIITVSNLVGSSATLLTIDG